MAEEVLDVCDVWIIGFSAQGQPAVEHRFSRERLERAGWRLEVPAEVEDRMRAAGVPPPP